MMPPPRSILVLLVLISGMAHGAWAQTTGASVTLPVVPATPGQEVVVPVTLVGSDPVVGFSFGVTHEPGTLTPVAIDPGNAFVATASNFFPDLDPDAGTGITIGAVIDGDLSPPFVTLTAGVAHEVLRIRYQVAPTAPLELTVLGTTGTLGVPPVASVAVLELGGDTPVEVPLPVALGGIEVQESIFRRGDTDGDGGLSLTDVLTALEIMFFPIGDTSCLDAVDANDNGGLGIDDAIYLLEYLFIGSTGPPPPPFTNCDTDPTPDPLGCTGVRDGCHSS